ncbi:MAG: hypothetical protein Q4E65_03325 [Clostridia bacterium]|nr:hypothetical protein [Clostridia bacterium]
MKRRIAFCAVLALSLMLCACAAPVAEQPQPTPAAPAAAPAPTPAATPAAQKQYAIQGPDGTIQYVDADAVQVSLDNPSDVCRAGEDVPLNHCADCPQATEGYNTAICSELSCCCPFCPYALDSPSFAGCQATDIINAAELEAALAKQEQPAS